MPDPIFTQKDHPPDEASLAHILGDSAHVYHALLSHVEHHHGPITPTWKYYGQKYGWQLKLIRKKRNLCFIIPGSGHFKIVFVFGDKAVSAVESSNISDKFKQELISAKKYMEGRGLSIRVTDDASISDIKTLFRIKLEN